MSGTFTVLVSWGGHQINRNLYWFERVQLSFVSVTYLSVTIWLSYEKGIRESTINFPFRRCHNFLRRFQAVWEFRSAFHFRFRHCHSVTRRLSCEKGIVFMYLYLLFKRYISLPFPSLLQCHKKVSVWEGYLFYIFQECISLSFPSLSQCHKKVSPWEGYLIFYIFFFYLGRYISLPFPSLSQCHKKVSVWMFSLLLTL